MTQPIKIAFFLERAGNRQTALGKSRVSKRKLNIKRGASAQRRFDYAQQARCHPFACRSGVPGFDENTEAVGAKLGDPPTSAVDMVDFQVGIGKERLRQHALKSRIMPAFARWFADDERNAGIAEEPRGKQAAGEKRNRAV